MKHALSILLAVFFLAGCATTKEMRPTKAHAASVGEVKLKKKKPNNELSVNVAHLAPANYIDSTLTTYVVWLKPTGEDSWTNIGQIELDEDDRTGELETTTPFTSFEVLVTAEVASDVNQPSTHVVLGANFEP